MPIDFDKAKTIVVSRPTGYDTNKDTSNVNVKDNHLRNLLRRCWLKACLHWGLNKYLAYVVPPSCERQWVFIVGAYNSGTTLLYTLLDQHPAISTLPYEGVSLASALDRPEDHGWPRMWQKCADDMGPAPEKEGEVAERTKREWGVCFDRSKPVWMEKSIANAVRIPWLIEYFQPAYFIHIVRNGYTVAEGIQRKTKGQAPQGQYPIADCARQWAETDRRIRESLAGYHRVLTIYYEELVADPHSELERIATFLELDTTWVPHVEDLEVHGVTASLDNQNPRSFARLDKRDLKAIEAASSDELAHHGYDRPVPAEERIE